MPRLPITPPAIALCGVVLLASCTHAKNLPAPQHAAPSTPLARSNAHAATLLAIDAEFEPETTAELGVKGLDDRISDLSPGVDQRRINAYRTAEQSFRCAIAGEPDSSERVDLELLADAARRKRRAIELDMKYGVPEIEIGNVVFEGLNSLLDDQVPPERRAHAAARLRGYVGMEPGARPITELARDRVLERLRGSARPFVLRVRVERYLGSWTSAIRSLNERFAKLGIGGFAQPMEHLGQQLAAYDEFLRREVLPRTQTDLRRPEELYAMDLEQSGIDTPPRELASGAREAFKRIQEQMQPVAAEVAKSRGLDTHDYRDVLRALKKDRIEGSALVALYEKRIREIETILKEHDIVSVPSRPLRFRIASEGESAMIPAPSYWPPPLVDNRGEYGTFLLPVRIGKTGELDDFNNEAASWWLTAHEGRPGHDLQFSRMVETHVSSARAIYGSAAANAEGWGLYAESLIEPYVPVEARLAILQARLMRAAHAFLDPEINLGVITAEEAKLVMTRDVVFSEAWANSSVQRYSVWMPGQAPSYFFGYQHLCELRREAEKVWGAGFTARRFHDQVIAQGLLPHALQRRAVLGL